MVNLVPTKETKANVQAQSKITRTIRSEQVLNAFVAVVRKNDAWPDRIGMQSMLNRMFRQQLHPSIWKCKRNFNIAIDLTLLPYHGKPYEDKTLPSMVNTRFRRWWRNVTQMGGADAHTMPAGFHRFTIEQSRT